MQYCPRRGERAAVLDVCIAVKTKPLPYVRSSQKGALIMNTRDSDTEPWGTLD